MTDKFIAFLFAFAGVWALYACWYIAFQLWKGCFR